MEELRIEHENAERIASGEAPLIADGQPNPASAVVLWLQTVVTKLASLRARLDEYEGSLPPPCLCTCLIVYCFTASRCSDH